MRAANVELDFDQHNAVDGYVLTGMGRRVLRRLTPAITASNGARAWSLTGPYGTGKSAFAIYLAMLFGGQKTAAAKSAHHLLQACDPDLAKTLGGGRRSNALALAPIPVTGAREPLSTALLRGLERSVKHHLNGKSAPLVATIKKAQTTRRPGTAIASSDVLELFEKAIQKISAAGPNAGVFLIVDELGRLLEFAGHRPEESDLALLQDLAEFAQRSTRPFLMMTIRHQSLSAYAGSLSPDRRKEWEKIQGRFEDIEFIEPAEEMLRLLSKAMEVAVPGKMHRPFKGFARLAGKAWELGIAPTSMSEREFSDLLTKCQPLHPLVATTLGVAFRRLGQNERSAFSFLFSHEPFGLQDFLKNGNANPLYGVDRLYDYLTHSVRESLYASSHAKHWAEIETSLDQMVSATAAESQIVKSIGTINALGTTERVRSTRAIVRFATDGSAASAASDRDFDRLISKSLVVERTYNGTLALWEGSDVDIDAELQVAKDRLDESESPAQLATRYFPVRPIVAKRHSFQTGALRYFSIQFCSPEEITRPQASAEPLAIVFVLEKRGSNHRHAARELKKLTSPEHSGQLFCLVPDGNSFVTRLWDLAALEWLRDNVKALEGDRTARKELAVRIEDVRRMLDEQLDGFLHADGEISSDSRWFRMGKEIRLTGSRRFQDILSESCDEVYPSSPRIRNELVNRRELSSAAAGARRNLIELMFQKLNVANLGISGTPPEMSMYLSVLQRGGLHKQDQGVWRFQAPPKTSDANLRPVWDAIVAFFNDTEKAALPASELFSRLAAPPFGALDGPLPVLLCAALIVHDHEVALYKDCTFIPAPSAPDFELLMKHPERYTIQRWRLTGIRTAIFHRIADLLGRELTGSSLGKAELLDLIKPLLRFFGGLNEFSVYTRTVSEQAVKVRDILQKASRPDSMLFHDLPVACGVEPFAGGQKAPAHRVDRYIELLREALRDLQTAYDRLLSDVFSLIQTSFGIEGDLPNVRARLTERAGFTIGSCGEPKLKGFLARMANSELEDKEWLEAIAGVVVIKPPPKWRDSDLDRFRQEIASLGRMFRHLEAITLTPTRKGRESVAEIIRIGVTSQDAPDFERVVQLTTKQSAAVDQIESAIDVALQQLHSSDKNDIALAALARVARKYFH
jgi:hypothetical protein